MAHADGSPGLKAPGWLSSPENRRTALFVVLFGAFLGVGYLISIYRPVVEHGVVPFTAFISKVSSLLLRLFGFEAHATGTRLSGQGVSFELRNGCNGVWATIIFVSAVLAFPSPLRVKLWGVLLGFCAIFVLNLARVISLYYIVLYYPKLFEGAHIYVWQTVVIGAAVLLWLFWAQRAAPVGPGEPQA